MRHGPSDDVRDAHPCTTPERPLTSAVVTRDPHGANSMGQPTERDKNAPEPNTPGTADAPSPDPDDVPYIPPVKAYERPKAGQRPTAQASSDAAPTQALPVVVGQVALPKAAAEVKPAAAAAGGSQPPVRQSTRTSPAAQQPAPTPPSGPGAPTTQLPPSGRPGVPAVADAPTAQLPPLRQPGPAASGEPTAQLPPIGQPTGQVPGTPSSPFAPGASTPQPAPSSGPTGGSFSGMPLGTVTAPAADGSGGDHPLGGLVGDGQPSRAPRALLMVGGIVVVLAGLYTGAQWLYADKVPTGTQVAGVDIGGLTRSEAVTQLTDGLAPRTREPIQVTAGEAQTTVDPAAAGLSLDADRTVSTLTGFSMSPARLWSHLFGGRDVEPVVAVDDAKLKEAVAGLVDGLAVPPVDGTVGFSGETPVATPAVDGTTVPADAATEALTTSWLTTSGPLDLPTEPVAPEITQEETDAALAQAQQVVSAPVTVTVGDQHPDLPPDALAAVTSFQPVDGALQVTFDGDALVPAVVSRTNDLLTAPDDAHFEFQGGRPVIVGGAPGTTLDPAALAAAVQTAALGTDRTAAVELVERSPEQSREALEALGVKEVISSFATPLTREPVRTANLRRGAELVTGTLVRPGETFSLIDTLSPIDASNGFQAAGVISNGVHTEGMGGGLSQMATTTYNAGFFAGFEDVEHRPHSVDFDRYPDGREATIFVGSLDMRFKNNSPYGAVMQSWIEGNELHVQIWSTKYFSVATSKSDRSNVKPTTVQHNSGKNCAAYAGGNPGYTITNYRKVTDPTGKVVIDESFRWTYRPDNPVVCDQAPAAPPAGPDEGGQ